MAKARVNKKKGGFGVDLPECPVCLDTMSAPIYQCQSGHSLCSTCTTNLCPAICPMCRQAMTQMRNWTLEDIIAKAKVPCPNKSEGCVYTMTSADVEDHLKECIFREMTCPLGSVFGKCSWSGKIKDMLLHFQDRHPENCNISTDSDVELKNVSAFEDDRYMFLIAQAKMLFIVTVKIDTILKMAYWIVQHIGSKKVAQQHIYEIHVTSKQDSRRKVMFFEYCFNDAMKTDEIFRQGKCAIMPLSMLNHFIKDKKLLFRILIKRIPVNPNQKFEKSDGGNASQTVKGPGQGPKGSGPRGPGPKGQGPRGPGHHGSDPRPKSPGPNHIRQKNLVGCNTPGGPQGNNQFRHPFNFKQV